MKRLLLLTAAALLTIAAYCAGAEGLRAQLPGQGRGSVPLILQSRRLEAKHTSFLICAGKVVMLQFTASWCGVCRKEMPFIEDEIWLPGKEKGLVVIGIDRDEPEATVLKFKDDMKITYPLALDPGANIFGLYAREGGRCHP